MSDHIINSEELEWKEQSSGVNFGAKRKALGTAAGGQKLGCSLMTVAPGKRAWPFHYHMSNEEAIYILSGKGTMRFGSERFPVAAGYYIAMPTGLDKAHQLINDSEEELVYLCVSTMIEPDVTGYPDSKKIGVITGAAPGGDLQKRQQTLFFKEQSAVPYWEDET